MKSLNILIKNLLHHSVVEDIEPELLDEIDNMQQNTLKENSGISMKNISDSLENPTIREHVMFISTMVVILVALRMMAGGRIKKLSSKDYHLNMKRLNDTTCFKEVFMNYLCAAMLEPVLAISGAEEAQDIQLIINLLMLVSICWWIWLISDAFDSADVTQQFKFGVEFRDDAEKNPTKYKWLNLTHVDIVRSMEKSELAGTISRDVGLWFLFACISSAWLPGVVSHRDVTHAYAIVFMWTILHHSCHQTTSWGTNYFVSFLFPSTALLPMQFCLPFMDTLDFIDDIDGCGEYIQFVKRRTGVSLIIDS